ncbi:hypothetical protein DSO57_1028816 [Entomophthora muscae]|uniref:Uncharacterized protein n=1 Tax=Entomophthora muscae TaxID=34485 RepID=A0ACC2S3E7_9FUNG|nr:hypothetical protein DSO57_1028816 [Entomophthora muscae]
MLPNYLINVNLCLKRFLSGTESVLEHFLYAPQQNLLVHTLLFLRLPLLTSTPTTVLLPLVLTQNLALEKGFDSLQRRLYTGTPRIFAHIAASVTTLFQVVLTPVTLFLKSQRLTIRIQVSKISVKDQLSLTTLMITVYGPKGKSHVLVLLNKCVNVNFIDNSLVKPLGIPTKGSQRVHILNQATEESSILHEPIIIDLEGSPFRLSCNAIKLSYSLVLGFPWLKENFVNLDYDNNRVCFVCNNKICSLHYVSHDFLDHTTLVLCTISTPFLKKSLELTLMDFPYAIQSTKIVLVRRAVSYYLYTTHTISILTSTLEPLLLGGASSHFLNQPTIFSMTT